MNEPSHKVTLSDIYKQLLDTDHKVDTLTEHMKDVRDDIKDHETRIRVGEREKWITRTMLAVVSITAFGVGVEWLTKFILL